MAPSDQATSVIDRLRVRMGTSPREPKIKLAPLPPGRWIRVVGWRHLVAFVGVVFALFPIAWMISASINPVDTLSGGQFVPDGATLDNYRRIFENPPESPFMTWLWNSYYISFIVATVGLGLTAMAAFAFSRFRFRGRRVGLMSLLAVQIFPQFLAFVAIFLLLDQIGEIFPALGLDTHPGLILVYLGGAIGFNTFLIKGFMDSVPQSLDESAVVDGATDVTIFWKIILPLTRPALVVIFIITFVTVFNEFILSRTLLTSVEQQTYIVGLQTYSTSDFASNWGQLAAGAMVGAVPIVLTFLFLQKGIVSGLTQGAVKG